MEDLYCNQTVLKMISKYNHIVPRLYMQGGIPNERYPESLLRNSRLTNHFPTDAIKVRKEFEDAGTDNKYSDLKKDDIFAEGKTINPKSGINFKPSVDSGGGRSFSQENLEKCFEKNSFYFLYETTEITDTHVTFEIYWIPITIIKDMYEKYGNKGLVRYSKFKAYISQSEIELIG
jgi:hypothetical protein